MKFLFSYKGLPVRVFLFLPFQNRKALQIAFSQGTGGHFPKQSAQLFSALKSLFESLSSESMQGSCYWIEKGEQSEWIFCSAMNQESALLMAMGLWGFFCEHPLEVEFQEDSAYYAFPDLQATVIDRGRLVQLIEAEFHALFPRSDILISAYIRHQKRMLPFKTEVQGITRDLFNVCMRFQTVEPLRSGVGWLRTKVACLLKSQWVLTSSLRYQLSKILAEAYQYARELLANRFDQTQWKKVVQEYARELNRLFKVICFLKGGVDHEWVFNLSMADPTEMCFELSARFFKTWGENVSRDTVLDARQITSLQQQGKKYLQLAVFLDDGKNIAPFMEKLDARLLFDCALLSETTALHVLKTPALQKKCQAQEIGALVREINWGENHALELLKLFQDQALPVSFSDFDGLLQRIPSLCLHIIASPVLRLRLYQESDWMIFIVFREIAEELMRYVAEAADVPPELLVFIDAGSAVQHRIQKHVDHSRGSRQAFAQLLDQCTQKMQQGNLSYQALLGKLYLGFPNLLMRKDIHRGCVLLEPLAQAGDEDVLTTLVNFERQEYFCDEVRFLLGRIYLTENPRVASQYFSRISRDSPYYKEAMFECANVAYCVYSDKGAALKHLESIIAASCSDEPAYRDATLLAVACDEKLHANPSVAEVYARGTQFVEGGVMLYGRFFSERQSIEAQCFDHVRATEKKLSRKMLRNVWREYLDSQSKGFWRDVIDSSALSVYRSARSRIYTDTGRYRVLREYMEQQPNSAEAKKFCKMLEKNFGTDFFNGKCTHHPTSNESDFTKTFR